MDVEMINRIQIGMNNTIFQCEDAIDEQSTEINVNIDSFNTIYELAVFTLNDHLRMTVK